MTTIGTTHPAIFTTAPLPEFIVGEVSCNWTDAMLDTPQEGMLCQRFERVVNFNHERGYVLYTFSVAQHAYERDGRAKLNETIVAVFRRIAR